MSDQIARNYTPASIRRLLSKAKKSGFSARKRLELLRSRLGIIAKTDENNCQSFPSLSRNSSAALKISKKATSGRVKGRKNG